MKMVEIKYSKTKSPKKKALYLMTLEQVIMENSLTMTCYLCKF
jgi:hypothetical protein